MDTLERLNLHKMIDANNVKDCTEEIRAKRHSPLIREDISRMLQLKKNIAGWTKRIPHNLIQCVFRNVVSSSIIIRTFLIKSKKMN